MIFHYENGALLCDASMRPLTRLLPEFNEAHPCFYEDGSEWDRESDWYGGHRYFICESLSRAAAAIIVKALGGYLFPEFRIPLDRQLAAGGPFYVHTFTLGGSTLIVTCDSFLAVSLYEQSCRDPRQWFRVYDKNGCMVTEFRPEGK